MALELHVLRAALSQQILNKRVIVRWGKVRIASNRIQLMVELTNGITQYHLTSKIREGLQQQIPVVLITWLQWSRNVGSRISHALESNTLSWSCRLNSFHSTWNMSLSGIKSALRLSLMSISPRIRSDRISPYVSTPTLLFNRSTFAMNFINNKYFTFQRPMPSYMIAWRILRTTIIRQKTSTSMREIS